MGGKTESFDINNHSKIYGKMTCVSQFYQNTVDEKIRHIQSKAYRNIAFFSLQNLKIIIVGGIEINTASKLNKIN